MQAEVNDRACCWQVQQDSSFANDIYLEGAPPFIAVREQVVGHHTAWILLHLFVMRLHASHVVGYLTIEDLVCLL
jgi:hypothetical protein